jgi:hypothetical protein
MRQPERPRGIAVTNGGIQAVHDADDAANRGNPVIAASNRRPTSYFGSVPLGNNRTVLISSRYRSRSGKYGGTSGPSETHYQRRSNAEPVGRPARCNRPELLANDLEEMREDQHKQFV